MNLFAEHRDARCLRCQRAGDDAPQGLCEDGTALWTADAQAAVDAKRIAELEAHAKQMEGHVNQCMVHAVESGVKEAETRAERDAAEAKAAQATAEANALRAELAGTAAQFYAGRSARQQGYQMPETASVAYRLGWHEADGTTMLPQEPAPARAETMRGLGDAVSRVTHAMGIQECEGCAKRRAALNAMFPFNVPGPERVRRPSRVVRGALWALRGLRAVVAREERQA